MKKLILTIKLLIVSLVIFGQQWSGSTTTNDNIWRNGNIGIGVSPNHKLHLQGSHNNSRILLHSTGGGTEDRYADLMLWASEPGISYSGVGIGNNVINLSTSPYIQRISNSRGGSYIRLLDGYIRMNVIKSDGSDINSFNIDAAGNVGIRTTNPKARLDVGSYINGGQLGSVLGRLSEGNSTGEGTYLGVRGYDTQRSNYDGKSFSVEHGFYGKINSSINFFRGESMTGGFITFNTSNNTERLRILANGNVGIGTTNPGLYKLAVEGKIGAHEIVVTTDGWSDFVFNKDYKLKDLEEVEHFIEENNHLPDIPSEKEVLENGIQVGEMNAKLLQKIEELTLYVIEQNKETKKLIEKVETLESKNTALEAEIKK